MKRFPMLILFVLLLAGCGKTDKNMDRALVFRQNLLQQSGCCFECNISADYSDVLYQFSLNCNVDNSGNVTFTVTKPEAIAGITGTISTTGGKIKFDDSVLAFPILSEDLPTPLSAPWLLITALRSGYIRTCDVENGKMSLTVADTYEEDAILLNTQFDEQDRPIYCELIWKGRRILSMQINSFTYL